MQVYAITNQKGGCGKTMTAIQLAAGLALLGKRVLLVDTDPQGHASLGLNIRSEDLGLSMYDLLRGLERTEIVLDDIILPVQDNLDLAPSNILLASVEQELSGWPDRYERLAKSLKTTTKDYDYVIIDCPPHLGALTLNALVAADRVVIPIEASFFSLHGVTKLFQTMEYLKDELDHSLNFRILPTMFEGRSRFGKEVLQEIRSHFPNEVYSTVIRSNVRLREAVSHGRTIFAYDKRARGALDYGELAKEVVAETYPEIEAYREEQMLASPVLARSPSLSEETRATAEEIQTFLDQPGV
jgi:chromosome partitioning protein